jgi:hypothetical protein
LSKTKKFSFLSPRRTPRAAPSRDVIAREERSFIRAPVASSGATNLHCGATRICAGKRFIDHHQQLARASLRRALDLLNRHASRAAAKVATAGDAALIRRPAAAAARLPAATETGRASKSQLLIG